MDMERTPDAKLDEIEFRSDVSVELVRHSASDADVLFAARVSTAGEKTLETLDDDPTHSKGLINFLMRDRHGCYDDETEVLTRTGWKPWPDVTGHEEFATLSPLGDIEYQRALRLIAKPYDGPMVRVSMTHVDLLVTPDHKVLAQRRRQHHNERYELVPASDLLEAPHRMRMGGGRWTAGTPLMPEGFAALLGLFIGDGQCRDGVRPEFHLHTHREINFLHARASLAGYEVRSYGRDRFTLFADEDFNRLAKSCYDEARQKIIPAEVLDWSIDDLNDLLDGLLHSGGSVSEQGEVAYSTTSRDLAGRLQELAIKTGRAAVVREAAFSPDDHTRYGSPPRHVVTFYRERDSTPRIGWTTEARRRQVAVEQYTGNVYCVTVPNGTLYVRRNGIPAWCGNSPFEHNMFTFYVNAPIFVFREFHRHRVFSFNEESGRYRRLRPVFYVPGRERNLVQEGKPGKYVFVPGTPEQHDLVEEATKRSCRDAYATYLEMLEAGIAREVARGVLPVAIYSSMYATCNARALMHFISLRTKREDAAFPSFPQREIEMVAERMEAEFARLMPLTHAAFDANGRVAP